MTWTAADRERYGHVTKEQSSEYARRLAERRRKQRRCLSCGSKMEEEGKKLYRRCTDCRAKIAKLRRERRAELLANNLCVDCGGPKTTAGRRCSSCQEKSTGQSTRLNRVSKWRRWLRALPKTDQAAIFSACKTLLEEHGAA